MYLYINIYIYIHKIIKKIKKIYNNNSNIYNRKELKKSKKKSL